MDRREAGGAAGPDGAGRVVPIDSLTHGIFGWAVSRALPASRFGPGIPAAIVISSVFPDADAVLMPCGSEIYLPHHRGFTHCLAGLLPTALMVAIPLWFWVRKQNFRNLLVASLAGVTLHVGLDWLNHFGVMPWYPFDMTRYQLDWVFVIDLFFTGFCLLGAAAAAWWKSPKPARAGLGLLAVHLAFCAVMHAAAFRRLEKLERERGWDVAEHAAVPGPGLPTRWSGLAKTRDGATHQVWFDVFSPRMEERTYREQPTDSERKMMGATEAGRVFTWFARYPVSEREGERLVVFDARFRLPPGFPDRRPFAIFVEETKGTVRFDDRWSEPEAPREPIR